MDTYPKSVERSCVECESVNREISKLTSAWPSEHSSSSELPPPHRSSLLSPPLPSLLQTANRMSSDTQTLCTHPSILPLPRTGAISAKSV